MAVVKTLKLSLVCFEEDSEKILDYLAKKRVFHPHVEKVKEVGFVEETTRLHQIVSKLSYCLEQLEKYVPDKGGLLNSLEDNRVEVEVEEFEKIASELNVDSVFDEISSVVEKIDETKDRLNSFRKFLKDNDYFLGLSVKFRSLRNDTQKNFSIYLFRISEQNLEKLTQSADELSAVFRAVEKKSSTSGKEVTAAAIVHKSSESRFVESLNTFGARLIAAPEDALPDETFKEYYERKFVETDQLVKEEERLKEKLKKLRWHEKNLKVALEFYTAELEKALKKESFAKTKKCVFIEGFVPERDALKIKEEIERMFIADCVVSDELEPFQPVILENKGMSKPVQVLTELYGYPSANEPDPTPLIAPWFLFFFGFCIGDAGYGLLMALSGLFLKRKFKLKESVKAFADMFIYGSLGAIILGILSCSYFSLDASSMPVFLQKLQVIDPINKPITILVISVVFGLIHLILGIAVNSYQKLRVEKDTAGFLSEAGKILLILGAALLITKMFGVNLNSSLDTFSKIAFGSGIILIVLFSSAETPGFIRRILSGLYNLYGMTSFLGDTISYARLMALFLSGVLIGMAVNIMVKIVFELLGTAGGIVLAPLIFVIGHLFNLLMSIVSAFIHSMRLQFVEFFKQFYADGGVKFNPIGIKEQFVKLVDRR